MKRSNTVILNLFQDLNGMLKQVQHDKITIILILIIAFFLRIYRLDDLMPFIGDHAWFYISARDMLLTGEIPLVGIASSYTWVHQGALWTYLLAILLLIFNFNPLTGGYFTTVIGVITVFFIYKVGSSMFSRFVGLTAGALYAASPLAIVHSRMPYHTSLIPLASLLFIFFLYKWIKGDVRFFPLVIFMLAILYNLELATMVFWILLLAVLIYGFVKGEKWFKEVTRPKVIIFCIFLFAVAMIPMILHDIRESSGFFQTTAFFRLIKIYLLSGGSTFSFEGLQQVLSSLFFHNQRLVFLGNGIPAFLLTMISFFYVLVRHSGKRSQVPDGTWRSASRISKVARDAGQASMTESEFLVGFWISFPLFGILISKTASEAYIPMIFPAIIFSIALLFNYVYKQNAFVALIAILFILSTNSYLLISKNYLMNVEGGYGLSFSKRLKAGREIVNRSEGREYNLVGKGEGSKHKSFTMNYEYLTWWLGHPPSKNFEQLKFIIKEK